MNLNNQKKLAAEKAVEEITSGMTVGLGTGSTFHFALLKLSEKLQSGELKDIKCAASSKQTELKAAELGIPLITLNELYKSSQLPGISPPSNMAGKQRPILHEEGSQVLNSQLLIDLTIDGADEIDANLNLIKGGGGALLREKIVVQASKRFIVIADESKLSKKLGMNFSVPIEVLQFAVEAEKRFIESLGAKVNIRKNSNGGHLITDEGNFIIDAKINPIDNVNEFAALLEQRAGIVEHGLFRSGLVSKVVCALNDGSIKEFVSALVP